MNNQENLDRLDELMNEPLVMEYCRVMAEIRDFERSIKIPTPTLSEMIQFRREQQQMSQAQMGQSMQIPKSRYKALESGKQEPSFGEARKLKGIGIPYDVIFNPIANVSDKTRPSNPNDY